MLILAFTNTKYLFLLNTKLSVPGFRILIPFSRNYSEDADPGAIVFNTYINC
jgi:hypothetical protein